MTNLIKFWYGTNLISSKSAQKLFKSNRLFGSLKALLMIVKIPGYKDCIASSSKLSVQELNSSEVVLLDAVKATGKNKYKISLTVKHQAF